MRLRMRSPESIASATATRGPRWSARRLAIDVLKRHEGNGADVMKLANVQVVQRGDWHGASFSKRRRSESQRRLRDDLDRDITINLCRALE